MNPKPLITVGVIIGTTVGGLIPHLWHASFLSLWGIFFSTLGGIAGIWLGYKISQQM